MTTAADAPQARDCESLYQTRLRRYVTALRNGMPDRVPLRPFVAEFTGRYAGGTCQELAHDYEHAFAAARRCAAEFDWDAVVPNMVYVWTGLTQALGLKYYGIPGIDVPPDTGFQYREPPPQAAFMRADEYDALIEDPTGFLLNVWLPRVAAPVAAPGQAATMEGHLALIKGAMALGKYFNAFGTQIARLRSECGTVSAIAGIFKAPMDILADKLRGYLGLVEDLFERRDKVLRACEALMPHLYHVAKTTADPARQVPIGYWMHRGGVPFVGPDVFRNVYWATVKPIVEQLWADGHQTLFYAEGKWDFHLDSFAELPERSIVYHVDQGDLAKAHHVLGRKFCLSGGIPNVLLARGTPEDVRRHCISVLDIAARDGGYIADASAIVQNDARIENMRAMTDCICEHGAYSRGHLEPADPPPTPAPAPQRDPRLHPAPAPGCRTPGVCLPWTEQLGRMPPIQGDAALCRRVWEDIDALAYAFLWQILLSF